MKVVCVEDNKDCEKGKVYSVSDQDWNLIEIGDDEWYDIKYFKELVLRDRVIFNKTKVELIADLIDIEEY